MSIASLLPQVGSKQLFRQQMVDELQRIGDWWLTYAQDAEHGGFYGEISVDNIPRITADKGVVMNARILWFFSEAAIFTGSERYINAARRAYKYIIDCFYDELHGGFYWSLDYTGKVNSSKKQVYAQGFVIYALSAYHQLTGDKTALNYALDCFEQLETHCIDPQHGGYFEAYTREWGKIEDVRLSEKDLNYPKTMNTHLHVLEGYTTLYKASGDRRVADALRYGIDLFERYMINHDTGHLRMFMDDDWQDHSPGLTYGHDIECAWLLYKALGALGDQGLIQKFKPVIVTLSETCLQEAIGAHGEVIDGLDFSSGDYHTQSVWWVQAEALVGFLTAYSLTDDNRFWQAAQNMWLFIYRYQLDHQHGEWLWHSTLDEPDGARDYKVGFWKGPYHNGRAMIEAARLLTAD